MSFRLPALLFWGLLFSVGAVCHAQTLLFPAGSTWNYLDDGTDQGSAWRNPGFNDTGWDAGAAQLGYGEFDQQTVLEFGSNVFNKYPTYYFRRTFTVSDTHDCPYLKMRMLRDDGAVVYINGSEVWRHNMPGGSISYGTFASFTSDFATENRFFEQTLSASGLVSNGLNQIAVEVHQSEPWSDDVSFDFELLALADPPLVPQDTSWTYLDTGVDLGTGWTAPAYDDTSWSSGFTQLGYGDGDELTVVGFGPDVFNKYITTYFRHSFTVNDASLYPWIKMRMVRDDGAVVYLNGTEVWRSNMPGGSITYLTPANFDIADADDATWHTQLRPADGLLMDGTNILAIEIHQWWALSSDISLEFELTGVTTPPDPILVRGPYLQSGTHTSAVVRWRTALLTDSRVYWGDAPDHLTQTNRVETITTNHAVTLAGLAPETTYYYAIGDAHHALAAGDTNQFFTTSPVPGVPRQTRVWVLGDSGEANQGARDVRDAFYAWNGAVHTDLLLMLGDNAYDNGTDQEYQAAVFDTYPETLRKTFLWPTLGNHDGQSAFSATQTGPYYDIFDLPRNGEAGGVPSGTEAYYSFDYANIHFVCLNSYDVDRTPTGAMMTWLINDLAAITAHWIIAFWHHPPYSKGSHNSDFFFEFETIQMRQNFLPLLEDAGVDLVLSGHSHAYERSFLLNGHYGFSDTLTSNMVVDNRSGRDTLGEAYNKSGTNGAVYAVAGSSAKTGGGSLNHQAMFISLDELGSMVLDVTTNRLDAFFIGPTPVVKDSFTILKDPETFQLTVTHNGPGTVMPAGGTFAANDDVDLVASPSNYYAFSQWSGDLIGTNNPAQIFMHADRVVTARFDAILVTNAVPQWWLAQYALPPDDAAALDDPDFDEAFTWEEYVADTVPTNPASRLRVNHLGGAPANSLTFDASTQRIYTLEFSEQLVSNQWTEIPGQTDVPGSGPGQILQDTVSSSDTTRVYRISVELP